MSENEGFGSGPENAQYFPWRLSDDAMELLTTLPERQGFIYRQALREAFKAGWDAAQLKTRPPDILKYPDAPK